MNQKERMVTDVTTSSQGLEFNAKESVKVQVYVTVDRVLTTSKVVLAASTKCKLGPNFIPFTDLGMKKIPQPGEYYLHLFEIRAGSSNVTPTTTRVRISQEVTSKFVIDDLKHDIKKIVSKLKIAAEKISGAATTENLAAAISGVTSNFKKQFEDINGRIDELARKDANQTLVNEVTDLQGESRAFKELLERLEAQVKEVANRPVYEAPKPPILPTPITPTPPITPPPPPVIQPARVQPAPDNHPKECGLWDWAWKSGLCLLLGTIVLVVFMLCLTHASSSQNVNVWQIGSDNKVDVHYQTIITNITAPTPEPSACERAREERRIEALTEATRRLDRWQRNEWLLNEKRLKEHEKSEQTQPAATVNFFVTQAAPAPTINQTFVSQSVQSSDSYSEVRNYPLPYYRDQAQRDYNSRVSAAINAGADFNVGFGNGGSYNYRPPVMHFIPRQRCWNK